MHECVLSARRQKKQGVTATDIAKRLLDLGFYAPSTYFPLIVEEALMIEPTNTASKETHDQICDATITIGREDDTNPHTVLDAPRTTPASPPPHTRAARQPTRRPRRTEIERRRATPRGPPRGCWRRARSRWRTSGASRRPPAASSRRAGR